MQYGRGSGDCCEHTLASTCRTDCLFEISSINRYTKNSYEAAITSRIPINKGAEIKYLWIGVIFIVEEETSLDGRGFNFYIVDLDALSARPRSSCIPGLGFGNRPVVFGRARAGDGQKVLLRELQMYLPSRPVAFANART
jgi:hypothetical protein